MVGSAGSTGEPRAPSASGFVCRERELAAVTDALASPPALVLVEGEAGVGKSRLLREFLAHAPHSPTTLVAPCPPFREPLTLGPVVDAIRLRAPSAVAELRLTDLAGALRPLFPEWSDQLPALPAPAEDATASRHRLFRALEELLAGMGVAVLVVEDVHWADDATLEFLLFLASRPDPTSLVLTYRPEDLSPDSLVRRMSSRSSARETTTTRIALSPLDLTGTAALVSSMLHDEPLSDEFAQFLYERTEGVPFAVEESVRLMHERTDILRRHGRWERVSLDELQVPATVRDAILERAGRLGEPARTVLRAAAVLAEPSSQEVVSAVSALDDQVATSALAEALASGLLRETEGGLVSFTHLLACRAVYEATPMPQRRALHRSAARTLEVTSPEPLARLARHFREAGEVASWHQYGEQAADVALAAGDEAAGAELLYDVAVRGDVSAESLLRLVRKVPTGTLSEPGRYEGLTAALRPALRRDLEPGVAARLRAQLGHLLAATEDYEAARAEMERALPDLTHAPAEAARAMIFLGWPVGTASSTSTHLAWLEQAAKLAPKLGPADRLRLIVDRVTALLVLGEAAGWTEAAEIPADGSSPEERSQVARGHLNVGDMALRWGRYAQARQRLDRALELADRHQYQRYRTAVLVTQAHLDWLTGSWHDLAARAAELAHTVDTSPLVRLDAALVEALLLATQAGKSDRAEASLEALLEDARGQGDEQHLMEPAAALARLRLARGRTAEALSVTDAPFAAVARSGIWTWATGIAVVRLDALVAANRMDEANDLVDAFSRWLRRRDAPAPRAALTVCRATVRRARGDQAAAAQAFARAAAAWEALPRPFDALLARERQADCLLAAGRTEDGVQLLSQTYQGLSALGASADSGRVARRLREHGVRLRRPGRGGRPSYGEQLSPRESDVLRLLVAGSTDNEIAERLYISPWTVRRHLTSARHKLKAPSRAALAVAAVEAGVLTDDRSVDHGGP